MFPLVKEGWLLMSLLLSKDYTLCRYLKRKGKHSWSVNTLSVRTLKKEGRKALVQNYALAALKTPFLKNYSLTKHKSIINLAGFSSSMIQILENSNVKILQISK